MKKAHKDLYIKIRSECIKQNEELINGDKLINGFSIEQAKKNALYDLEIDLKHKELRITLPELLLNSVEDCILIAKNRMKARREKMVNEYLKSAA
jgi:hypothetical protein